MGGWFEGIGKKSQNHVDYESTGTAFAAAAAA